jgi:hypothetical protein
MTHPKTTWGAALKFYRVSLRLNQESAARICKMSRRHYARRENEAGPVETTLCFQRLAIWSRQQQAAFGAARGEG